MGAHRIDRTGSRVAGLVALALLAGCTGCTGGEEEPSGSTRPTATAGATGSPSSPAAPSASATVRVREVARVKAQIVRMPEGVRVVGGGPTCIQYERTGGTYGRTRYQVAVDFTTTQGAAFQGPKGTKVFFDVRVEASGSAFDGRATFREADVVDDRLLVEADLLTTTGRTTVQPESIEGIQEFPPAMTACHVTVLPEKEGTFGIFEGRPLRDFDLVVDPEGNDRDIEEA